MLRRFSLVHLSLIVVVYAEGVNVAASHPLISGSLAFGVGIFALKSIILILHIEFILLRIFMLLICLFAETRRFVYYNTLRMFSSEEVSVR